MPTLTPTAKLRRDINEIAQKNLGGMSLDKIAKQYKCSRPLVTRVMLQELPEDFWSERARRRARGGKKREGAIPV